ncbi:hypothetical protein SNE25_13910 [Mucilaginibacter sabulilitoris]|uniref:DUF4136 domain-containing protein n=1 Tax=Mucilaginibacter sabulilitoris TaxID=1173583 RepID=A0ABZ0TU29_9SPHI|nr:hypothetical protein [Mucilaginibacter sabulilitoris]WPU96614.1 hypothetical protein SNE25_13910 [Mucilaginibacter sabulilitoris]
MRSIAIIILVMLRCTSVQAQKWQPGNFTDVKGNRETGLIRVNPSGKGPIKDEGFIEFKENKKTNPYKLSASDLRSFVAGKDSFVVAHAPQNESWGKEETDFVKVALDEPTKLYVAQGGKGGGGSGFGISPGVGVGYGSGGYGGGFGGGVGISLGGGRGRNGGGKTVYYYGVNTAEMKQLTNENFEDIMTDIMGDEPDVVEKIHAHQYSLKNIEKLIAYFNEKVTKSPPAP